MAGYLGLYFVTVEKRNIADNDALRLGDDKHLTSRVPIA